jgi:bisanhydrobacterioruberin hydratase
MRTLFKNKESFFTFLIILFFLVGLVFHIIPFTQKYVLAITDITMLLTNSIVLFFVYRDQENNKLFYWSIITFILTFLTELMGVRTGSIFGTYHYGETMFIQLYSVPIVIGMNWVILMLGSYSIALMTKSRAVFIPLLSSLLIVGFDFLMEEVAMKLDYWQWAGKTIPLQNYIAWFFISLIFSSVLVLYKVKVDSRILKVYFLIQLIFFIVLRIFLV